MTPYGERVLAMDAGTPLARLAALFALAREAGLASPEETRRLGLDLIDQWGRDAAECIARAARAIGRA